MKKMYSMCFCGLLIVMTANQVLAMKPVSIIEDPYTLNLQSAQNLEYKRLKSSVYKLTTEDLRYIDYKNSSKFAFDKFDAHRMFISAIGSSNRHVFVAKLMDVLFYIVNNIQCDKIKVVQRGNIIEGTLGNYYTLSSKLTHGMDNIGLGQETFDLNNLKLLIEIYRLALIANGAVLEIIDENKIDEKTIGNIPLGLLQYVMAEVALKILQIDFVRFYIESQQKQHTDIKEYFNQLVIIFTKIAQRGKILENDPSIKLLSQPISFDGIKLTNTSSTSSIIMNEWANLRATKVNALGKQLAQTFFPSVATNSGQLQSYLSQMTMHSAKGAELDVSFLLEYAYQLIDRIKSHYSLIFPTPSKRDIIFYSHIDELLKLHSNLAQHILTENIAPTNSYDIHCLVCLRIGNIIKQLITDLPKIMLTEEQKATIQEFDQSIKQKLTDSFQQQKLIYADLEWLTSPGAIAAYGAGATPAELENLTPKDTWLTKEEELDEEIKKEVEEMKPCIIKAYKNQFTSPNAIEAYKAGAKFADLKDILRSGAYTWLASTISTASYKNGAKFQDLKKLSYLECKMFNSYAVIEVYEAGATFDDLKNLFPSQKKNNLEKVEEINEYLAEFKRFTSLNALKVYKVGRATFTDLKQLSPEKFKLLTSPEAITIYELKIATFADLRCLPEERLRLLTSQSVVEIYKLEEVKFTDIKDLPEERLELLTSYRALNTYKTKKVTFADLNTLRDLEEIKRFISNSARYAYSVGADFSTLKSLPQDRFQLFTSENVIKIYKAGADFITLKNLPQDQFELLTSENAIKACKAGAKFVNLRDLTYEQIRDFVPSSKANTVIDRMGK